MIIFFFSLSYLGSALNSYLSLSYIVRNVTSTYSAEPSPPVVLASTVQDCDTAQLTAGTASAAQLRLHEKLRRAIEQEKLSVEAGSLCISSELGSAAPELVRVRVQGRFQNILPGHAALPFSIEAKSLL